MNKIYKAILSVSAVAMIAGATLIPADVNAWGDSAGGRPSYTIAEINEGALGDKITFNSISDGKIGDEKNFVAARKDESGAAWYAEAVNDVKDGDIYVVRLYVHNNNPYGTEKVAKNVKVNIELPTWSGKSLEMKGHIRSSNAEPDHYWDEVVFNSDKEFKLEYVKGSAKYTNAKLGEISLPDSVVDGGTKIGYEALNGLIPGCFEYDSVVTIKVKVNKIDAAKISKVVRLKGTKTWAESVDAKVGDEVEYQIEYVNLLTSQIDNVMIRDLLPTNVEYVADSTYLYNSNYQSGVLLADNTLTIDGINIGSYVPSGNAYVRFTGKVVDKTMICGKNKLVNWANVTVNGDDVYTDDASVMVEKDDESCHEPEPTCETDPTMEGCEKPKPTCEEDPTQEGCKKPEPEPTCETDPTMEGCKKPEPKPEPTPEKIVSTGPAEVLTGALGAGSVVTALGYYIASRKKLM